MPEDKILTVQAEGAQYDFEIKEKGVVLRSYSVGPETLWPQATLSRNQITGAKDYLEFKDGIIPLAPHAVGLARQAFNERFRYFWVEGGKINGTHGSLPLETVADTMNNQRLKITQVEEDTRIEVHRQIEYIFEEILTQVATLPESDTSIFIDSLLTEYMKHNMNDVI